MTLDTNWSATEMEGVPELFEFEYGGIYERYTNWPYNLTFLGETFVAKAISRSKIRTDAEYSDTAVEIRTTKITCFDRYIANTPVEPTNVRIWRALSSDLTDYAILFTGTVTRVSFADEHSAQAHCSSLSTVLSMEWPIYCHQSFCNWALFDNGCGLDDSLYGVTTTINGVSGATITVNALSGYAANYFRLGIVELDTDFRMITKSDGATIYLQLPFDSRGSVGAAIIVYPGCDGAATTCKNKFANFNNFFGHPYIPSKNPVIWGV